MTKVKMTAKGMIVLPKEVMDRRGFAAGTEFEVVDGGRDIVLKPVEAHRAEDKTSQLTLEEFLALRIPYDGPPVTDEMMRGAIDKAAIEDWARLERQWHDNKGN